jgi:hypothetical protein
MTQHTNLRHGDLVEVRGPGEILATLDERGMLAGLPFMPEMIRFCGRRFVVDKRAEKVCDTIYPLASNRLPDTVLLGSLRCDGSGHGGCQADCRLYWKEAWLRRVSPGEPSRAVQDDQARSDLERMVGANTKLTTTQDGKPPVRYVCQNTELSAAGQRLKITDPAAYLRVYTSGNVSLPRFLRVMARALIEEPMRKLRITPRVFVRGTSSGSSREAPLNLQPGDLVQVKSKEEIIATLSPDGRNRGLFFDREMLPYCGGTYRVKRRITRFIDDRHGGQMIELKSDCLTLEGVVCSGELSPVRWFCPREIQSFWREAWLRRVETDTSGTPVSAAIAQVPAGHHAGTPQVATDEAVVAAESQP